MSAVMPVTPEPDLNVLGRVLQKMLEDVPEQPLPWQLIDLLCLLDEKEEEAAEHGTEPDVKKACAD